MQRAASSAGEHGAVPLHARAVDGPHRAPVPPAAILPRDGCHPSRDAAERGLALHVARRGRAAHARLAQGLRVEGVALALRHQPHLLVRAHGAVGDGLGQGVGLRPDDLLADEPARIREGHGQALGHEGERLGAARVGPRRGRNGVGSPAADAVLESRTGGVTGPGVVGVADDQPERAVVAQHAGALVAHGQHPLDVLLDGRLQAEGVGRGAVVDAQAPVGRRGDDGLGHAVAQGKVEGGRARQHHARAFAVRSRARRWSCSRRASTRSPSDQYQ